MCMFDGSHGILSIEKRSFGLRGVAASVGLI
jgi:hypothetical protein